jgi:hypothetical protein
MIMISPSSLRPTISLCEFTLNVHPDGVMYPFAQKSNGMYSSDTAKASHIQKFSPANL